MKSNIKSDKIFEMRDRNPYFDIAFHFLKLDQFRPRSRVKF